MVEGFLCSFCRWWVFVCGALKSQYSWSMGKEALRVPCLQADVCPNHGWVVFSSLKCSNCYMVWGGDFVSPGQQGRISHTDLVIGCLVDLATGLMTFTANGKESNTFFQVSPAPHPLATGSRHLRKNLQRSPGGRKQALP
jgi:hypothetical protein